VNPTDPSKVNWFKEIMMSNVKPTNPDYGILLCADVLNTILRLLVSTKPDYEIQEELFNIFGESRFELLSAILEKRGVIKDYVKTEHA
jgi:hypothetical protein